ncbi:MAG: DDE-type integrase/transposase/recombinase [Gammaproteobacteria bacterium]|nr:DDE-type integrase/transposase/recombinase [Gammaproteobacteria bacterium]
MKTLLLDLFSRKVVGWSMSNSNNGKLIKDALNMAIQHRQPKKGFIHHTGRGSTYAMQSYRNELATQGMLSSMSRKGVCWDNAVAESFFANLKNAFFDYIEIFYNKQRLIKR